MKIYFPIILIAPIAVVIIKVLWGKTIAWYFVAVYIGFLIGFIFSYIYYKKHGFHD
ncbi:MAG: hypothetical protein WC609_00465 [Candidatus Paceibacterota bacterium]|jgi:hypothetical protein